ncbi:hypothetical protein [Streptomyces sp. NPDC057686]|uniref:hypothetical protein n=1 Tax=Streptomyces sp. NPDC057686 TaxID=3346212 RepID=UPI0036B9732B
MPQDDMSWGGLEEEAAQGDELATVKRERDRIARQLFETKHRQADYLQTVWGAASDAIGRIQLAPVPVPEPYTPRPAAENEEYAVALLSDLQTGKITPDYDSTVARDRVMRYARKIVALANIQRLHHPVRHCVVPMLGDMVEGVDIFPGQQWLIDSTLYDQLFNTTPALVADFLRYLLAHFDSVTVYAVDGNHGRIGRRGQFGPMDNADRMLYRIIAMLLRDEPRFQLHMTDPQSERNWFHIMELGNYSALLIHGDQIRGSMGYPFYGLGKKVHSWGSGGLGRGVEFTDIMLGHYHQLARIPLNHRTAWANGSTESTNTFAAETLAGQSEPSQFLLFCDPEKGRITASYAVDLRED